MEPHGFAVAFDHSVGESDQCVAGGHLDDDLVGPDSREVSEQAPVAWTSSTWPSARREHGRWMTPARDDHLRFVADRSSVIVRGSGERCEQRWCNTRRREALRRH